MPGDPHSVWLRNATTCSPLTIYRVFVNVQLHMLGDPHSVWLKNATTCNPVTLWRAFVNMQLHMPGDPQCFAGACYNSIQFHHPNQVPLPNPYWDSDCAVTSVWTDRCIKVNSFILPFPVKTKLSTAWTAPLPCVCNSSREPTS